MQSISDFLNNTTLTAGQQIIVGVIIGIILAIPTICIIFKKKITILLTKLFNPHPEEAEKRKELKKRIKNHTTTDEDMAYAFSLSMKKIRLSKGEMHLSNVYAQQMLNRVAEYRKARELRDSPSSNQP